MAKVFSLRTAIMSCLFISLLVYRSTDAGKLKCEKIAIPLCQNLGYNFTYTPNRFLHRNQIEAASALQEYRPLLQVNCSSVMKHFLCWLYAPVCDQDYDKELLPCRSLCEQAKSECLPILKKFGYGWPKKMECHLFPKFDENQLCMLSSQTQTNASPASVMSRSTNMADNVTLPQRANTNTPPATTSDLTQSSTSVEPTGISTSHVKDRMKCEKLTIPLCQDLGYNLTYSPNRFLHEDQKEAALEVHQFWPLVEIKCSPVLKFFLCSLYAPVCDEVYGLELLPCRSVCKQAKTGCLPIMEQYGFKWPEKMDCNKFPKKKDDVFCMVNSFPASVVLTSGKSISNKTATSDLTQSGTTSVKPTDISASHVNNRMKCEELTVPLCRDLGYNLTYSPNRFLHEDQREAALEVHQFSPLVEINCSPVLKFFLCSLYAPTCDQVHGKEILPCRSLCEQAKTGCLPIMKQYGFKWPEKMDCSKFPEKKDNGLCMANAFPTSVTPGKSRKNTPTKYLSPQSSTILAAITATPTNKVKYEKLTIRLCNRLSYNTTSYPNRFGHEDQLEAAKQLGKYKPLIRAEDSRCAEVLRYFLCSLYAPPSDVRGKQLIPCRSLCKKAKRKCRKSMKGFGLKWPKNTKCRSFPRRKNNPSCFKYLS